MGLLESVHKEWFIEQFTGLLTRQLLQPHLRSRQDHGHEVLVAVRRQVQGRVGEDDVARVPHDDGAPDGEVLQPRSSGTSWQF
jgi:hypothetical protein